LLLPRHDLTWGSKISSKANKELYFELLQRYVLVKLLPIAAQTKLEDLPLAIAVQAIEELKSFNLPDDVKNVIQGQITELNEDHSIYSLLRKRGKLRISFLY
jgi:hypothetical protein